MAKKGASPQGMRKAGKKRPGYRTDNTSSSLSGRGSRKKVTEIGGHLFEQVGKNTMYSEDGMDEAELRKFAENLHGSAKQVVGSSGRNLTIDDIMNIAGDAGLRQTPRKEPHLIDHILDGDLFNPEAAPPLGVLHHAKKFIFDASASEFVGSLLVRAQTEVLEQHNWARPPFDTTWVELDHAAYWERGLKMRNDMSKGAPDNLFGFLVDHGTVSLFSYAPGGYRGGRGKSSGCGPFQYKLHTPISFEEEMAMARRFELPLKSYRQALLGGLVNEMGNALIEDSWWGSIAGEVVRAHKMFVNPVIEGSMNNATFSDRRQALMAGAGDLKLVITLLLMVTRPRRMFAVTDSGPKRMLYKGHNLVRRAHSVVTMRLSKEKALHRAIHHEFTSQHRQMHDVRGHWAETRHGPVCREHSWEPIDKDHFYCLNCPAKRWWRKSHTRGELRLGDKTTDYTVKR